MTSGYILIVAILVLGGVIATVGDRIGTRVGKARLSLFNLRPRKTAVLVTILTGGIISASTLGIMLAVSEQLRTGLFELGNIQKNLAKAREELDQARNQKSQVEKELKKARSDQTAAQQSLDRINLFLKAAIARQAATAAQLERIQTQLAQVEAARSRTEAQLERTQGQLDRAEAEKARIEADSDRTEAALNRTGAALNRTRSQLSAVSEQAGSLRSEVARLEAERANLDRETQALKTEQANLEQAVQTLQQYYQYYQARYEALRQGNVAIFRGQVLAAGVVRIVSSTGAQQAVDQLLREANRNAVKLTRPGVNDTNEQIIQITRPEVEQLIDQIEDGRDYVVRILSVGNYVLGEKNVQVVASATLNQVVFLAGDVIAAANIDPSTASEGDIQRRIELLLAATEFRARGAGVLTEGVQIGADSPTVTTMLRFVEQLKQYGQPVEVKVVTPKVTSTAGPLQVELIAIDNGQVVLSTDPSFTRPTPPSPSDNALPELTPTPLPEVPPASPTPPVEQPTPTPTSETESRNDRVTPGNPIRDRSDDLFDDEETD